MTDSHGLEEHYRYDALRKLIRIRGTLGITTIKRDTNSRPFEKHLPGGMPRFLYDALRRLSAVTKDGETLRDYTYDSFGNRIEMKDHHTGRKTACTYDALNRLVGMKDSMTGIAGNTTEEYAYTYDNRGNLIRETKDGGVLHEYTYGATGRLICATDHVNRKEAAYVYNGLGQRISKTVRDITGIGEM